MSTTSKRFLKISLSAILLAAEMVLVVGISRNVSAASIAYTYDSLNRLSQAAYADGTVITYTYDAAGNRLTQATTGGPQTAPAFTSAAGTTFAVGLPGSFMVMASGAPAPVFSATGLPAWATLNAASGLLSGTPTSATGSPFTLHLTANNGVTPNATQVFTLAVVNPNPLLAITNVRTGLSVSNAVFSVAGTAGDNVPLTGVFYSLNGSAWTPGSLANNGSNWTAQVTLLPGTNAFQAFAVDAYGKTSATNRVILNYLVTAPLQLQLTGLGTISPNDSNAVLELGQTYSLTATPATGFVFTNWSVSTNWLGGTVTNKPTVAFTMASNLTLQATFVDVQKPVLTITNLASGQRVSNAVFTVRGSASDNWQVASVWVRLNGGGFVKATGTNNWSGSVTLTPGTNVVLAYAVDNSGNHSSTNSVTFQYILTAPLQVQLTGLGTISPNDSNAVLELGQTYSLTATPATGFVFTNWSVSTNWLGGTVTNKPTVAFTMASNLTLQATFVDVQKPVLTITNLASGQRVSNAVFTVRGSASDNWQVASVWVQLNGGGFVKATGTNNWSDSVTPTPGTNVVQAFAVDYSGNHSTTNSVAFQYVVTAPLQVRLTGLGTLSPNDSNAVLVIGQTYSLTVIPATGFIFTNWLATNATTSIGWSTNMATLQFMMASNLVVTANLVEVTRPVVTVTSPRAAQRVGVLGLTVAGTASDNWQVTNVWFSVGSNGWQPVMSTNGYKTWAAAFVSLSPGTNVIKVYGVNLGGIDSLTNSLAVVATNLAVLPTAVAQEVKAANPAVVVTGTRLEPDGLKFELQISGEASGIIQVSTNLTAWATVAHFAGTNTTISFTDPGATNSASRFYRAVEQ